MSSTANDTQDGAIHHTDNSIPATYAEAVANHSAFGKGSRPWVGTPQDVADLATQVERIVRAASDSSNDCWILVRFAKNRESRFDSKQEFVTEVLPAEIPTIESVFDRVPE